MITIIQVMESLLLNRIVITKLMILIVVKVPLITAQYEVDLVCEILISYDIPKYEVSLK